MEQTSIKDVFLDDKQAEAVALCLNAGKRLAAVTGPAGSGKTTIIREAYDKLIARGYSVALAAPTGKAARRITEATGIPAVTVHKLLEYGRPGERDANTGKPLDPTIPNRHRGNPLTQQAVIVDEYAMINYELHNSIIAALPSGGLLRAFGDKHQLPPIDNMVITKGAIEDTPFQKLLNRPGDSVTLEKVYRQGEGSQILENANKIRQGHLPVINKDLGEFYIKLTGRPIDELKDYVREQLELGVSYGSINHQIISPSKKSWVGTAQLNQILRGILNPSPVIEAELPRHSWDKQRVQVGLGDKVVCTENTYDLRDFFDRFSEFDEDMKPYQHSYIPCPVTKQMLNGETGVITQIYPDNALDIDFGDRIVEVPAMYSEYWAKKDTVIDVSPLRAIDLAYALTTHKCQGSEFDTVVYVLNKTTQFAQSRQNLYTAVTRARSRVLVLTDQRSLQLSVYKVKR